MPAPLSLSLAAVAGTLQHVETLDFNLGADGIPAEWLALRREAQPIFERLEIVRLGGELLTPIDLDRNPRS